MTTATAYHEAAQLLQELRAKGVIVEPVIDLDGPVDVLTDMKLAEIRRLKPALLALLVIPVSESDREESASHVQPTRAADQLLKRCGTMVDRTPPQRFGINSKSERRSVSSTGD